MIQQAKLTFSTLGKALEKKGKTIEGQGEKQLKTIKEHGKCRYYLKSNKMKLDDIEKSQIGFDLKNK